MNHPDRCGLVVCAIGQAQLLVLAPAPTLPRVATTAIEGLRFDEGLRLFGSVSRRGMQSRRSTGHAARRGLAGSGLVRTGGAPADQ
jgi:hypothetical protein